MSVLSSDIFIRALVVGLLFALAAGSMGTVVVIRRMSFFADAIAHASLTGIAFGLLIGVDPLWAVLVFSILIGLGIGGMALRKVLALDTIIGVFYSTAVAVGVLIISGLKGVQVNLDAFLFGDILAVSNTDVWVAVVLVLLVVLVFVALLGPLLQLALNRDLAQVHGVRVWLYELLFMVFMAVSVAVGIKLVGIILVGPLIIMPAATAKNLSRSFLTMLSMSVVIALVGVVAGLFASAWLATPSGPTIVVTMAVFFSLSLVMRSLRRA